MLKITFTFHNGLVRFAGKIGIDKVNTIISCIRGIDKNTDPVYFKTDFNLVTFKGEWPCVEFLILYDAILKMESSLDLTSTATTPTNECEFTFNPNRIITFRCETCNSKVGKIIGFISGFETERIKFETNFKNATTIFFGEWPDKEFFGLFNYLSIRSTADASIADASPDALIADASADTSIADASADASIANASADASADVSTEENPIELDSTEVVATDDLNVRLVYYRRDKKGIKKLRKPLRVKILEWNCVGKNNNLYCRVKFLEGPEQITKDIPKFYFVEPFEKKNEKRTIYYAIDTSKICNYGINTNKMTPITPKQVTVRNCKGKGQSRKHIWTVELIGGEMTYDIDSRWFIHL